MEHQTLTNALWPTIQPPEVTGNVAIIRERRGPISGHPKSDMDRFAMPAVVFAEAGKPITYSLNFWAVVGPKTAAVIIIPRQKIDQGLGEFAIISDVAIVSVSEDGKLGNLIWQGEVMSGQRDTTAIPDWPKGFKRAILAAVAKSECHEINDCRASHGQKHLHYGAKANISADPLYQRAVEMLQEAGVDPYEVIRFRVSPDMDGPIILNYRTYELFDWDVSENPEKFEGFPELLQQLFFWFFVESVEILEVAAPKTVAELLTAQLAILGHCSHKL